MELAARLDGHHQHHQLAPLASLDCSITEPLSERTSLAKPFDTPTLSGYFECDQLSDMVDDSLFELTTAGCLSRSIFKAAANQEEPPQLSAAALLASRQPYDYSSSSTIPASLTTSNSSATTKRARQQPPPPSRHKPSDQPARRTKQPAAEVGRPEAAAAAGHLCAQCQKAAAGERKKRGPLFGLFNLFGSGNNSSNNNSGRDKLDSDNDNNGQQPCRHLQQRLGMDGEDENRSSSSTRRANQGGGSSNRRAAQRGHGGKSASSAAAAIKSRDSIRLTNQRRQRAHNNGPSIRPSSSHHDLGRQQPSQAAATGKPAAELLLDFSGRRPLERAAVPSSQSSYSLAGESGQQKASLPEVNTLRRQTKSVKFTMPPDRVVTGEGSQLASQGGLSAPSGRLQPGAPIIKHRAPLTIPKSSSYSQTDSSRNLEALLARYDDNEALVREINEKLKLTETIASPRSALDLNVQSDDDDDADDLAATAQPDLQLESLEQEASLMSCCSPHPHNSSTPTSPPAPTTATPHEEPLMGHHHQRPQQLQQQPHQKQRQRKGGARELPGDPNSVRTSSSEMTDASSEAGFTSDWLNKQRALV